MRGVDMLSWRRLWDMEVQMLGCICGSGLGTWIWDSPRHRWQEKPWMGISCLRSHVQREKGRKDGDLSRIPWRSGSGGLWTFPFWNDDNVLVSLRLSYLCWEDPLGGQHIREGSGSWGQGGRKEETATLKWWLWMKLSLEELTEEPL